MADDTPENTSKSENKIIHIGLGAFHRAHQALYTSELIDKTNTNWSTISVNLFGSTDLIRDLNQQNCAYTVLERGAHSETVKTSYSIERAMHPLLDGKEAVLDVLANEATAIVSLTITEKGYCIEPSSGELDATHPLIQADLSQPSDPQTAIGYIAQAIKIRKSKGFPAFTVLSCDNIQSNGDVARKAILGFIKLIDVDLFHWANEHVTFPNTMVDRIVPAITQESLSYVERKIGHQDPCAIVCEPFRQWIIEDDFVCGRPNWDEVGANFVDDVIPFEHMKLRLLNGSHSLLSYLGYLSGYKYISDVIADSHFRSATLDFMLNEQAPTLSLPQGVDIKQYANLLIERFSNTNLQHATSQIAMDGSQKLPPRFVESLVKNRSSGNKTEWLEIGIAGWMSYITGNDDEGNTIELSDPLVDQFKAIKVNSTSDREVAMKLLSIDSIFSKQVQNDTQLMESIIRKYIEIQTVGAKRTLYKMVQELNTNKAYETEHAL